MQWDHVFASRASRMKASEIRELLKLLDQPDVISFAGGIPDPALFPRAAFAQAMAEILAGDGADAGLQYSVSEGHGGLRDWIAGQMGDLGVACGRENILITSGSQQALDYLGKMFLSAGDTALVGWPTYLGALGAFNAYEPRYDRLAARGNRTAADYAQAAGGGRVKFAYASVDFANPTGETLDATERGRILDLAESLDCAVIEDAAYQSLRYDGEAVPPILAMDCARHGGIEQTRTLYCGSFSKTLAPGLRVGWVCAASEVIQRLVLVKQASDLHSPTLNQMAVERVVRHGFDAQVAKIRGAYAARRDHMLAALARHMPKGVTWTRPEGGMFVWVTLPEGVDGAEVLARSLRQQKVAFVPGQAFFADGSGANSVRLSFSCADGPTIEEGIARLGHVLK